MGEGKADGVGAPKTDSSQADAVTDPDAQILGSPSQHAAPSYLVHILGVCLVLALLLALWSPDRIGASPYMPAIFAFLIATIAANAIPSPPKDVLRLSVPNSLSPGAVWLLCFLLVIGTIMIPRLVDRYTELERVRLCARVAAIGLQQPNGGDAKGRHVQCRTGR
jgi:hypothetical protein